MPPEQQEADISPLPVTQVFCYKGPNLSRFDTSMTRHIVLFLFLTVLLAFPAAGNASVEEMFPLMGDQLRAKVENLNAIQNATCRNEFIYSRNQLPRFYEIRGYRPAWLNERGLIPQVDDLVRALHDASLEGLIPGNYHLAAIESLIGIIRDGEQEFQDTEQLTDLDILLTDAFFIYGANLSRGRVDPETLHVRRTARVNKVDFVTLVSEAVDGNTIATTLESLKPPHPAYGRLKEGMTRYREIALAGGWGTVPEGPKLKKGDVSERVPPIRRHLVITGELQDGDTGSPDLFDERLETAVMAYQVRHGLDPDGVVGARTLAALNETADALVRKIELNLERWRWLPRDLGKRHVLVNSAAFRLDVVEGGEEVMSMRVVVGRNYRSTPVVSSSIVYMVLNPYWNIPTKLAVEDIAPQVLKNPQYLAERKIHIFTDWRADALEVDQSEVNWKKYTAENFPYKLRQDPGPKNPLGRIKFIFPNIHDVYLHDTPERNLFYKASRGFSSGCIRIEKPYDLALYLLRGDREWSRQKLNTVIRSGEMTTVHLPKPVPVHLLYWTAWADEDGMVQFREDIYERDAPLYQVLMENPSMF